jgi:hypothetical protein
VPKARLLSDETVRRAPRLRKISDRLLTASGVLRPYHRRIDAWRSGHRPRVSANREFHLATVVNAWERVLTSQSDTIGVTTERRDAD